MNSSDPVEVSFDGGHTWQPATLIAADGPHGAWVELEGFLRRWAPHYRKPGGAK